MQIMEGLNSVRDADVADKRALVRVDCNVPLQDGAVADDARIKAVVPTLELLHTNGAAQITLLAHLGRPGGHEVAALRMAPVEKRLRELTQVPFTMHENLRFDPREESNDEGFAKELAASGDIFVNEAFADSHRAHASIVGIPKFLSGYLGLRFEEELAHLSQALTPPQGSVALIGGAKFETKEPLILKLLSLYAKVYLGGALANDLLRSRGAPVGESKVSEMMMPVELAGNTAVVAPTDVVVIEMQANTERTASVNDVRANEMVVDIGPTTALAWGKEIAEAPFVLWNGPVGIYEEGYIDGTDVLANALAKGKAPAIIGGGDTTAAIAKTVFDSARIFISTGGGAMLQFLSDGTLPGIQALKR